jgi:hypothetical protein
LYGFKRLNRGPNKGAYYHPKFQYGEWETVKRLTRLASWKHSIEAAAPLRILGKTEGIPLIASNSVLETTSSSGLISSTIPFSSQLNNQCNNNYNNNYSNIISDSYSTPTLLVDHLGSHSQNGSSALFENGPVFKNTINLPVSYSNSVSAAAETISVEASVKHYSCEIGINTDISVTSTFNV